MKATGKSGQAAVEHLRCALEDVINMASSMYGLSRKVESFYPPDDGGDFGKTIIWLEQRDLITVGIQKQDENFEP